MLLLCLTPFSDSELHFDPSYFVVSFWSRRKHSTEDQYASNHCCQFKYTALIAFANGSEYDPIECLFVENGVTFLSMLGVISKRQASLFKHKQIFNHAIQRQTCLSSLFKYRTYDRLTLNLHEKIVVEGSQVHCDIFISLITNEITAIFQRIFLRKFSDDVLFFLQYPIWHIE